MFNPSIFNSKLLTEKDHLGRTKFLQLFYRLGILFIPLFLIKNYFQYPHAQLHWISVPLYVALLLMPVFGRVSKNYFWTAFMAITIAALILSVLLFEAGGLDAPGLIWLSVIPVAYAISLGQKGAIIGGIFLLSFVFVLKYLEVSGQAMGSIQFSDATYRFERLLDIVLFAIYTIFTTQYYVQNEENNAEQLRATRWETDTLLRTLMHDIATPLTVANLGSLNLKKLHLTDEERMRSMKKIDTGLENITKILHQVRTLKSMQDGKASMKREPIDVNSSIRSILELLESVAAEKKISFSFTPEPSNPRIYADQIFFKNMVISNFLTNAIKFSHEHGKICIFVEKAESPRTHEVQIRIIDEGIGIPKDIYEKIWKIDALTSRPGTNGEKGTGYGMPLAKEFTERMGGRVELTSATLESECRPVGTQVVIHFPMSLPSI